MSTHSQIAVKLNNGSYATVYCHYDGYPIYMGWMLYNKFNTENRINNLVLDGGHCIRNIGYVGNYGAAEYFPYEEDETQTLTFADFNALLDFYTESLTEYAYVYEDGEFYGYKLCMTDGEFEMRCLGKLSELKCCTNSNFEFAEKSMDKIDQLFI